MENNRAHLYIDGFNLYYPIHAYAHNHLKWLDLWALGKRICTDHKHNLVGVTYCSAFQNDPEKKARHATYIDALENSNVRVLRGHYMSHQTDACTNCGVSGNKDTEKQSDINLALSVFADAMTDQYDCAYLLTADSDQAATAKFLRKYFPRKKLITVAPPNQDISRKILDNADAKRSLNWVDIEKSRFQSIIFG